MSHTLRIAKKRRLSLSLMVILLLHWTFSSCVALADTLCLEPDGVVVWENAEDPCHLTAAEGATDKPCVDYQAQDGHDDHSAVYAKLQLTDSSASIAPLYIGPIDAASSLIRLKRPDATGPPVTRFSIIVRETAYLHI